MTIKQSFFRGISVSFHDGSSCISKCFHFTNSVATNIVLMITASPFQDHLSVTISDQTIQMQGSSSMFLLTAATLGTL